MYIAMLLHGSNSLCFTVCTFSWAPARGEQGGQVPTLEKIRVGMAHPGNFSRGLKTENELILVAHSARPVDLDGVIEDFVRLNDQRKDDFGL